MSKVSKAITNDDINSYREEYGCSRQVARKELMQMNKNIRQENRADDEDDLRKVQVVKPEYYLGDVEYQFRAFEEQFAHLKMTSPEAYERSVKQANEACWNRVKRFYGLDNKYKGGELSDG